MKTITVDGKNYSVVEDLGRQGLNGEHAVAVETDSGERIAVKSGRTWLWHKPEIMFSSQYVGQ